MTDSFLESMNIAAFAVALPSVYIGFYVARWLVDFIGSATSRRF